MSEITEKNPRGAGRKPMPADHRASSIINLRCHPTRKAAYNSAARAARMTLVEWMFAQCDNPAAYTPPTPADDDSPS